MARTRTKSVKQEMGKTRVQLRFDDEVWKGVQRIAEDAGISANQFMQGIARWAIEHAVLGEPKQHEHLEGFQVESHAGCLWFDHHEKEDFPKGVPDGDCQTYNPSRLVFRLDLTERNSVQTSC